MYRVVPPDSSLYDEEKEAAKSPATAAFIPKRFELGAPPTADYIGSSTIARPPPPVWAGHLGANPKMELVSTITAGTHFDDSSKLSETGDEFLFADSHCEVLTIPRRTYKKIAAVSVAPTQRFIDTREGRSQSRHTRTRKLAPHHTAPVVVFLVDSLVCSL